MYKSKEAKELLKREYGWQDYGKKHEESKFTKWFQEEYLPEMGIDKNRAHYSSLINSGQMTRDEALKLLKPVNKTREPVDYKKYKTDEKLYNTICKIIRIIKKIDYFKRLYY